MLHITDLLLQVLIRFIFTFGLKSSIYTIVLKIKHLYIFTLLILLWDYDKNSNLTTNVLSQKPNIIVIYTDDQGYGDIGCHGNTIIKTPNLDTFSKTALELTNFHVGTTCTPSRSGLLTGRHPNRNNTWHTIAGCSILTEDEVTIADILLKSSYNTAMIGKWHLGDNYPFRPQDRGFNEAIYHGGGGVQQTPDIWNNNYFDDTYFRNGTPEQFKGYCTDVWFNEAIKFIDNNKNTPFYIHLAPNAAHSPFNVPDKYAKLYKDAPLTKTQKRFYGMITNIDDNFGKLVAYLKEKNLYNNTIIVFSTDNGSANAIHKERGQVLGYNAGLRGLKGSHYDGGHRVPCFISWPNGNILQKQKLNVLTANVDLLPTLIDLLNIDYSPQKTLDGTSIAKLVKGDIKSLDRMLVVDSQRNQWPEKGKNSCVMSTNWRLIDGKELYNTAQDPGQKNNIAASHPHVVKKMQTFYDNWWTAIEPDFKYAHIPFGYQNTIPVNLTIHDLHTEGNVPWNQELIRKGEFKPNGYYSIKVENDGVYQFKLSRYPIETKLGFNATPKTIKDTPYTDGLPQGKPFSIGGAKIIVGDSEFKTIKSRNTSYITIEAELKKGKHNLKSILIKKNGEEIPAYYTTINFINPL